MNSTTNPLSPPAEAAVEEDPQLLRAAKEYLAAIEAGERPNRKEFAARYADISVDLTPYLDAVDMLHPTMPAPPSLDKVEQPSALGDFRIVREIGRGGMGVVYEAVQLSLGRRVALKVLPFAAALDSKQLQRFKNEAQAAAQLHHTNIVPVYAVGCERGVHYYAMQLIEGQNLSDMIQELRETNRTDPPTAVDSVSKPPSPASNGTRSPASGKVPAPSTRPNLAVAKSTRLATRSPSLHKSAARLIVQAALALEHAHQLGVIHRDVKPANLMVDANGNIWVTDFGLAQFQSCAGLTRTGDLLGTLRYMSPEQAGGQRTPVDARTDIYSLGATLYELLTLEPLFERDDYKSLLRQVLHDEPRPPRAVDRSVPMELETIVLKAVSKSPADRYATAQEFADDLQRFLDNLPIKARRPTMPQRVWKWCQRHPAVVVASVAVLALLSAVSLASTALVLGEQAKTDAAYKSERRRADEAEQRFRLAQQSADELYKISEEELAGKPGTERLRKRILDSVLSYYHDLIDQRGDDPKAQAELIETKNQVNAIVTDLEVLDENGRLDLLSQRAVLDDLGLTTEERSKVENLAHRLEMQRREGFGRSRPLIPAEEARQLALDSAKENKKEVEGILSKPQRDRLPQIALQQQGTAAFREPDVAAELKLTAMQRRQIRTLDEGVLFAWMQEWRRMPPDEARKPDDVRKPDEIHKANEQKRQDAMAAAMKVAEQKREKAMDTILNTVLTEEQNRQWKLMTGEPFKGPTPFIPPFFPGGGRQGGGPKGGPPPGQGPGQGPPLKQPSGVNPPGPP